MNRLTLALGVALAALVAAAPVAARPAAATATTVTVQMKEFKFVLSKKSVPHGKRRAHWSSRARPASSW
ncbi:MAG: hypothetical protein E6G50_07205 [Actinobacteria bacterium]|nr:MAG: hypothetical protein E6G50_07205 [Actinomycetota bacterium]